jgi:rubrerythrin
MGLLSKRFAANSSKQLTSDELARALRIDIARLYEAIIGYEARASATYDSNAKKILQRIANEQRRHVGELMQLLHRLNPKEQQNVEQGRTEFNTYLGNL